MEGCFIKRFLYYFGWTVVIGFIIYFGIKFQVRLEEEARMSFEIMPVILFGTIFPIVIGLFMRLPKLIIEMKQHKQWTFDWVKFIAIALPSFCIMSMWFLPLLPFGEDFYRIPNIILVGSPTIQTIAGIVFGYILLDSLKK